jgi:long-subunit acyl-CoA synthetase (AMP-forming)
MAPDPTRSAGAAPVPMDRNALRFLIDGTAADPASSVYARERGNWIAPSIGLTDEIRGLAAALSAYGLGEGARAAVLGSEGIGTLRAGLAVVAAGATLLPLDPALSDDAVRTALVSSGAVQAIAADERQLTRVLAVRPELPALELVLLMSATPSERKPPAMLVEAALEVGLRTLASEPDVLRRAGSENDGVACLLVDRAGETRPVSRAALVALADVLAGSFGLGPGKTVLAALPVGGVERLGVALAALNRGTTLLLPDPIERLDAGLDQRPADTIVLDRSRLEGLFREWDREIDAQSWIGRRLTRWALRAGTGGESPGWKQRMADGLVLGRMRAKLGGRAAAIDVFVDGGQPPESEAISFFSATGLSLRYLSPGTGDRLAR